MDYCDGYGVICIICIFILLQYYLIVYDYTSLPNAHISTVSIPNLLLQSTIFLATPPNDLRVFPTQLLYS